MPALDDLLDDLYTAPYPALRADVAGWLRDSRRFQAFAATYPGKVRAKLRNARDGDGVRDVRAELEAAALLLRDERITLVYEPYVAAKQRGPDFIATFKGHTPFTVEVRRVRAPDPAAGEDAAEARAARLAAVLIDKVGQMPPGLINLLWLADESGLGADDVTRAAAAVRRAAERQADDPFTRRGYAGAADFLRRYPRLSGVVVRGPEATAVWLNPLARRPLPPAITAALRRV